MRLKSGKNYYTLTLKKADEELYEILEEHIRIFEKIDSIRNSVAIKRIDNYEILNDIELFKITDIEKYLEGELYIYTEDVSIDHEIMFKVNSNIIKEFISEFLSIYKQPFFGDKTIIICPRTSTLLLYFEEGYWFLYKLPLRMGR